MSERIRIEGIYSGKTLEELSSNKVFDFVFDFRPKSFNFIQEHHFLKIIKELYSSKHNYYLRFDREKDFVVSKILSDMLKEVEVTSKNIFLEFSDSKGAEFYEQFKHPFFWHFNPLADVVNILNCSNIAGVIFPYDVVEEYYNHGGAEGVINNFISNIYPTYQKKGLILGFYMDWDSNIFHSLFDFVNFDFISLPLNFKVEKEYRSVDHHKIIQNLDHYRKLII